MATHEVDQKYLAFLAKACEHALPDLSGALLTSLGIGIEISPYIVEARRRFREGRPIDDDTRLLHDRIVFLANEGMNLTDKIFSHQNDSNYGDNAHLMAAKLRASYYHIACILRNDPPVPIASYPVRQQEDSQATARNPSMGRSDQGPGGTEPVRALRRTYVELSPTMQQAILREPIPSTHSETSNITNPYPSNPDLPRPPPGLGSTPTNPRKVEFVPAPEPDSFIFKLSDWRVITEYYFTKAVSLSHSRSGSDPLRLALMVEYCAFLFDCLGDWEMSRKMAKDAIRDVYESSEEMTDETFGDASDLVVLLGRMMRRTPRAGPLNYKQSLLVGVFRIHTAGTTYPDFFARNTFIVRAGRDPLPLYLSSAQTSNGHVIHYIYEISTDREVYAERSAIRAPPPQ